MIIHLKNSVINTNNIAILKREENINTNSFISEHEYCISINGVRIKFSTEQDRDIWYDTIERAMTSE